MSLSGEENVLCPSLLPPPPPPPPLHMDNTLAIYRREHGISVIPIQRIGPVPLKPHPGREEAD